MRRSSSLSFCVWAWRQLDIELRIVINEAGLLFAWYDWLGDYGAHDGLFCLRKIVKFIWDCELLVGRLDLVWCHSPEFSSLFHNVILKAWIGLIMHWNVFSLQAKFLLTLRLVNRFSLLALHSNRKILVSRVAVVRVRNHNTRFEFCIISVKGVIFLYLIALTRSCSQKIFVILALGQLNLIFWRNELLSLSR